MAKKHQTRFKVGERVNDCFTLVENFCRPTTKDSNRMEWLWKCQCDCGEFFNSREHKLGSRYGCHSCTNRKTTIERADRRTGIDHIGLKNRLLKEYKCGAVKWKLEFSLTFDEFVNLLEGDCVYCGVKPRVYAYQKQYMQKGKPEWAHNGIDRIDSSKGYTIDNCVSCCTECNYAKHEMSVVEYKEFIKRVYNFLILKGSQTIPEGSTSQANGGGNGTPQSNLGEDIVESI